MEKKFLVCLWVVLFATIVLGTSQAALIHVGEASYNDGNSGLNSYRLIYDDVQHLIWLDYTHELLNYNNQKAWAESLNSPGELKYQFFDNLNISWTGDWRLPATVDGLFKLGYDGTTTGGYNITTSELGHLFYKGLGNLGRYDIEGNSRNDYGLTNTGLFLNLEESFQRYGSNTEYANDSTHQSTWGFSYSTGAQSTIHKTVLTYGLAVRPAYLVPLPGTVCLLCSGLIGLIWLRKNKIK